MQQLPLSDQALASALTAFGVKSEPKTMTILQSAKEQDERGHLHSLRLIARLDFEEAPALVLRLVVAPGQPEVLMEQQAAFCNFLHKEGIPCPRQYRAGGRYCLRTAIDGGEAWLAAEDFEAGEVSVLDEELMARAGSLLGRMHSLSLAAGYTVGTATIFDIRGRNDIALFEHFYGLRSSLPRQLLPLFNKVEAACRQRHKRVLAVLSNLPVCAVQGDLSNLFLNQKGLGVFDFNNCGDVHPVSDLVLEGLMLARQMDYEKPWTPELGERLFASFLQGYQRSRALGDAEKQIIPDIYALGCSLYMMQVKWGPDPLYHLLESGNITQAEQLLESMLAQISCEQVPGLF